ncbi:GlxA family transcriptional regulator [Fodinicola acaciae]|uniref:GlxA family transcriptional regulator n=1 Tax=Fodinicola acaciae TaxID=2681555 RepID=UPI0013D17652|nr:helix-turn-helix domain-containing protein [Fodinicola acaciae]
MPQCARILPVHDVIVLALPAVVAFDLAVPSQVFGHPDERDRYRLTVCAPQPGLVPTTSGFDISVKAGLEALRTADTVVVPGYSPHTRPPTAVIEALRAAAERGARLMSVCTGAFALAATGLLDGRRAATHWRDAAELATSYPAVKVDADVLYVSDEPVLTSAGIAAGLDLCVHVMRVDHGEEVAAEVARRLVVAPHRTGGQAQFLHRPVPASGTGLAATCSWALDQLAEPLSVADLARHAGWAPRTFARRFRDETGTTPARWLTAQRLLRARQLLESSDLTVEQVAERTGLGSAANLRLLLRRDTGTSPSHYRRAYRG